MPRLVARNTSRSNSFGVRDASCPSIFTLWLTESTVRPPKV